MSVRRRDPLFERLYWERSRCVWLAGPIASAIPLGDGREASFIIDEAAAARPTPRAGVIGRRSRNVCGLAALALIAATLIVVVVGVAVV